mmetsp:Transcript_78913/g.221233  ORF Transcript_78913/g.221233 Transcript_78913/m.221233 type:complete len:107 (+) Transcript_78913:1016-1336(+)
MCSNVELSSSRRATPARYTATRGPPPEPEAQGTSPSLGHPLLNMPSTDLGGGEEGGPYQSGNSPAQNFGSFLPRVGGAGVVAGCVVDAAGTGASGSLIRKRCIGGS